MPRSMRRLFLSIALVAAGPLNSSAGAASQPDILLIMADDLGFSDLGCYGGEIATPQLDALAAGGLRYSQFYNTGRCWPTRASLLTGYYAQQVRRDSLRGVGGYQGKRPAWAPLVSQQLQSHGYRCYHSGKWHIDGHPRQNGFAHSYHTKDTNSYFRPSGQFLDGKMLSEQQLEEDYYETTRITDHALSMLRKHLAEHRALPFFQYLAFTAPHFPLHAEREDIERYATRYVQGWDAMRNARWQALKKLGILAGRLGPLESHIGSPYNSAESLTALGSSEVTHELPWIELTDAQRQFQAAKMAVHAAMIDRMDREIARVIRLLRDEGRLDNTLVLFLSDNGASSELLVRGEGHDQQASPGSAETFLCLGPAWSRTANTPFRRHKSWVHEGGIATPLIAHWPSGIKDAGSWRSTVGHVIDIPITLLDIAGVKSAAVPTQDNVPSPPGVSFSGSFTSNSSAARPPIWWRHAGHRAIRDGDWKLVAEKGGPWELYHLQHDRTETQNLAVAQPARVKRLASQWEELAEQFATDAKQDLPH